MMHVVAECIILYVSDVFYFTYLQKDIPCKYLSSLTLPLILRQSFQAMTFSFDVFVLDA